MQVRERYENVQIVFFFFFFCSSMRCMICVCFIDVYKKYVCVSVCCVIVVVFE
jgi:hypothetical protein